MKYRHVELLGLTAAFTSDQTKTVDIDLADPITRILIDGRVTNGGNTSSTAHPLAAITKIEIVDGSEVIFNLTGMCADALDIYNNGEFPRGGQLNYLGGNESENIIALDFGRYLYDPELALDPKKFRNLQIKVTHDVSAGGMAPASCKLGINALVFDEKVINPIGFLMAKEIKDWSGTAAAHEYTDLPVDFPYRKLLLQAYLLATPPHWIMDWVKLSEDQDKKVLFNDRYRDLMYGIGRKNAHLVESFIAAGGTTAQKRHITPTMDTFGAVTQRRTSLVTAEVSMNDGDGSELLIDCASVNNVNGVVHGFAPHGVLCIPFGNQDDLDDWYDVANIGNLKLDVTDGTTTTTEKVFAQQLRRY